jgi:hypothetical protein
LAGMASSFLVHYILFLLEEVLADCFLARKVCSLMRLLRGNSGPRRAFSGVRDIWYLEELVLDADDDFFAGMIFSSLMSSYSFLVRKTSSSPYFSSSIKESKSTLLLKLMMILESLANLVA